MTESQIFWGEDPTEATGKKELRGADFPIGTLPSRSRGVENRHGRFDREVARSPRKTYENAGGAHSKSPGRTPSLCDRKKLQRKQRQEIELQKNNNNNYCKRREIKVKWIPTRLAKVWGKFEVLFFISYLLGDKRGGYLLG